MRPHRRQGPLEHVLVAGDFSDLDSITALLVCLPDHAYGQVYVEAPSGASLPTLPTPPRVTLTRLAASAGDPGLALATAVAGWVGEWVPDEPVAERAVTMWVGASVRDRIGAIGGCGSVLERL